MKLTKEEVDKQIAQSVSIVRERLTQAEGEERISQLIKDIVETIVPERLGDNLHICRPKAHTVDPIKLGYRGYAELPNEYNNCVFCGAKPSQMRYETMTPFMEGVNAVIDTIQKNLEELLADRASGIKE